MPFTVRDPIAVSVAIRNWNEVLPLVTYCLLKSRKKTDRRHHALAGALHMTARAPVASPHFYDAAACGGAMMDSSARIRMCTRAVDPGQARACPRRSTVSLDARSKTTLWRSSSLKTRPSGSPKPASAPTHSPGCLELYGTEGSLFVGGPEDRVRIISNKLGGALAGMDEPDKPAQGPAPPDSHLGRGNPRKHPQYLGLEEGNTTHRTHGSRLPLASREHSGAQDN